MALLENIRRFMWAFIELGFLAVLTFILVHLLLGENSGEYVSLVVNNVVQFANEMGTPSLIGIGVILAMIFLVKQRIR